jgi:virginiamycin B lyase
VRSFGLPNGDAGLMMPAVDAQGNVWVGEMQLNRLARLDPATGQVTEWTPPNGKNSIMQVVVDASGQVWFTEEAANYVGRFDPQTQTFSTFPLPSYGSHRFGPQDLAFDGHGILWFTGLESGRMGQLDPTTGQIQTWPVPALAGQPSMPYALALAPDGRVWYGELDGSVGWLDPTTGATQLYPLADSKAIVFSMAGDAHGRIWFTELSDSKLGRIDTATSRVTELAVPTLLGSPQGMYQDVVASDGSVWFACSGVNALVRYMPDHGRYMFYQLSRPATIPYGVALDRSGTLWFTGDGTPNYIGELQL